MRGKKNIWEWEEKYVSFFNFYKVPSNPWFIRLSGLVISNWDFPYRNREYNKTKFIQCIDCGEWFEVEINSRTIRCADCYKKERSRINAEYRKKTSS